MFLNFSNHPSDRWNKAQRQAAEGYGEIRDVPFPDVPSLAKTEEITILANQYSERIIRQHPDCVMCQGEFTLTMAVVRRLQKAGILCVCACSERRAVEEHMSDGTTKKTAIFEFVQFRPYEKNRRNVENDKGIKV